MKLLDYWHFCFTFEELTTIWFSKIASLIYITTVKKKILLFATTQMNLKDTVIWEIRQAQKDKCSMSSLLCKV